MCHYERHTVYHIHFYKFDIKFLVLTNNNDKGVMTCTAFFNHGIKKSFLTRSHKQGKFTWLTCEIFSIMYLSVQNTINRRYYWACLSQCWSCPWRHLPWVVIQYRSAYKDILNLYNQHFHVFYIFSCSHPRKNLQIPNYTGCIGGEEERDDPHKVFIPTTVLRTLVPKYTDTAK